MKKTIEKYAFAAMTVILAALLTACACKHSWRAATCTEPIICEKCGETQGEALGHDWIEADCITPKTCERCGLTQGESLGHDWSDADCTTPQTCLRCGQTQGEALGHKWVEADCVTAKTCSVCGETEGEPLGHDVTEWTVVQEANCGTDGLQTGVCSRCGETVEEVLPATGEHSWDDGTVTLEATCTEDGAITYTCTVCGQTRDENIPAAGHTAGDWIVTVPAQSDTPGTREIHCTVCDAVLETESYEMTDEEKEDAFKSECTTYSYETLARTPDDYIAEKVHLQGEVIQVMESGDDITLRVDVTYTGYYWTDTVYVEYTRREDSEPRILEDDIIDLYGYSAGTVTYETVMGNDVTIPGVLAIYVDIN